MTDTSYLYEYFLKKSAQAKQEASQSGKTCKPHKNDMRKVAKEGKRHE